MKLRGSGRRLQVIVRAPRYVRLMWNLLRDERLDRRHKGALLAALGYNVSPIDLVPGVIPVLGQIDDLAVLLFAIRAVLHRVDAAVAEEHLRKTNLTWHQIDDDLTATLQVPGQLLLLGARWARQTGRAVWHGGQGALRRLRQRHGANHESAPDSFDRS